MTTQMQQALNAAGLIDHNELSSPFASEQVANRVGFVLSANFGKAATRIQKLANPPRGSTPEMMQDTRAELVVCLKELAWGMDNIPNSMRDIEEAINEWCGGGYTRPADENQLAEVSKFLGITTEQAKATAETNRLNRTAYLTIRRQGLAPIMIGKINEYLAGFDEGTEPTNDIIEKACISVFQTAIMWGNWAEAALAKADMVYHCGKSPDMPNLDNNLQQKANMIRDRLASAQEAQAQRDKEALMSFDLNLAA